MSSRLWIVLLILLWGSGVGATTLLPSSGVSAGATDQIIIKLHPTAQGMAARNETAQVEEAIAGVGLGIPATYKRAMGGNAHVIQLPGTMSLQEAQDYATLLRSDPDVAYAEPDQLMFPTGDVLPNDPQFNSQWHYSAATADAGAVNLPAAWGEVSHASNDVVVAVVDTGVVGHPDLSPRLLGGSAKLAGRDFVTGIPRGNDGDGRDADPSDPGDWVSGDDAKTTDFGGCTVRNSSWHGTHVAGTVGASSNNALGVAGVAWNSKILMARALGKCGGYLSDIADAIRWSAGEAVNGVVNPTPAKIINLSLGGTGSCGSTYQDAINAANALGATVVAAAGNNNQDVSTHRPANCQNVIAVTALARGGAKASFSNVGVGVDIAAPGVSVLSTLNGGTTSPTDQHNYVAYHGTSMAAPHVSGVLALMLSANSHLIDGTIPNTMLPALLEQKLKSAARAFATGTGNDCTTSSCGAGVLDAYRAVMSVKTPPTVTAGDNQTVQPRAGVTLQGAIGNTEFGGNIVRYQWEQTAGVAVTLANPSTLTPTFVAPSTPETLAFRLTVTNDVGLSASSMTNVTVVSAPVGDDPCQPTALNSGETLNGRWASGCESKHRGGSFRARYYRFTLATAATVKFDLKSNQQDAYLYLLQGADANGSVLTLNDDSNGTRDSQIVRNLPAGTYTLEATTYYAGKTGDFSVSALASTTPTEAVGCAVTNLSIGQMANGQWATCPARKRGAGYYARHYTFTLTQAATVTIDLKSSQQDAFLYLMQGNSEDGSLLAYNDDSNGSTNSQIKRSLGAGTYTLEATTYYKQKTGAFTLQVAQ